MKKNKIPEKWMTVRKWSATALLPLFLAAACQKPEQDLPAPEGPQSRWNKVWEYTPAPGQFINDGGTADIATPEAACRAAEKILSEEGWTLSLGGFGGYVVVGFDHKVLNDGGWNLAIEGNSFDGSSEPGIVWVMQDENGNGLPDDHWYELKGSEYGKAETRQDYSVTYFRPAEAGQAVQWKDSEGQEGQIDYMGAFHRQDSYYPAWIAANQYTLTGTCLKSRSVLEDGVVHNRSFAWGYADNWSTGCIENEGPESDLLGTRRTNHFKISDAVQPDGTAADLPWINFVKIQTGVNAKGPLIGELSTEIVDIQDYNLLKK